MDEIIKIKCPHCGAVLAIKNQPGIENMSATCPNCKTRSKFVEFKRVVAKPKPVFDAGDETDYRANNDKTSFPPGASSEETAFRTDSEETYVSQTGHLRVLGTGQILKLELGENTIGRKATTSTAKLQIDTPNRKVSRNHSLIEVKLVNGKTKHYFSNTENKNQTLINGSVVEDGDKIILNDGDQIQMSEVALKFSTKNL